MKKFYTLLVLALVFSLVSCTNDGANDTDTAAGQNNLTDQENKEVYKSRITYEDLTFLPDLKQDLRGGELRGKDEDYYTLMLDGEKTFSFILNATPNNLGVRVISDKGEMIKSEVNKNGRIVHVFDETKTGIHRVIVHLERNTRLKDIPVSYEITFNRE